MHFTDASLARREDDELSAPQVEVARLEGGQESIVVPSVSWPVGSDTGKSEAPSRDRVVLQTAGGPTAFTLNDAEGLRGPLFAALKRGILHDRDELIQMTRNQRAAIDPNGMLRIGLWTLQARGNRPVSIYRLEPSDDGMRMYVAQLERAGAAWTVKEVRPETLHRRRWLRASRAVRGSAPGAPGNPAA